MSFANWEGLYRNGVSKVVHDVKDMSYCTHKEPVITGLNISSTFASRGSPVQIQDPRSL